MANRDNSLDSEQAEQLQALAEAIQRGTVLWLDGEEITWHSLTFREKREVKQIVRTQILQDEEIDWVDVEDDDIYPAIIYVVRRRANPDFTLDEALDMKQADLQEPQTNGKASKRPTKARASGKG